jgi:hypothetical protein
LEPFPCSQGRGSDRGIAKSECCFTERHQLIPCRCRRLGFLRVRQNLAKVDLAALA